jgi:thiol-disulfide isomerase/thioredoxin
MGPIAERGLHAVTILLLPTLAVVALRWWQKRRSRRARPRLVPETGKVSIVYFHAPTCGVCRVSQKPILERLLDRVGRERLQVVAVDAADEPDVAREWGVATVPCTYVIDRNGEVTHVNNGLASEPTLWRQVS